VRRENDGDASRQPSKRDFDAETIRYEPSRTRCVSSFARTRHTSGMKAYSGFARTEYTKTNLAMRSRKT
jgi:hypothetical protein